MRHWIRRRPGGATPGTGRYLLLSAVVLAVLMAPFAMASGEGDAIEGGVRNPSSNQSTALTRETEILTENGTYGTRQSNKRDGDGGGAIYGCRSATGHEPCIRANNLNNGRAFEFDSRSGTQGGYIDVGNGNPNTNATPFGTNAAGKVANLNADRVDDLHADDIIARAKDLWAVVGSDGTLTRKNGAASSSRVAAGEYEVAFGGDVRQCAYNATIATGDASEAPGGEVGASHRSGNANAVHVVTRDSGGVKADRPFHLTVNC
ncbi:MAG: hypothetical protein ACRDLQ_11070 [Solirubrobacterales bacterium]